jgi:alpha-ketoglutarate-dependent taurine dioxygenase
VHGHCAVRKADAVLDNRDRIGRPGREPCDGLGRGRGWTIAGHLFCVRTRTRRIWLAPENGRKALYLNPVRMESIEGMDDNEALALIGELMDHATRKKYEYRHRWRQGDWVIWDNRSVMHQANADYDMNERRYLFRLMLKGEVPIPAA